MAGRKALSLGRLFAAEKDVDAPEDAIAVVVSDMSQAFAQSISIDGDNLGQFATESFGRPVRRAGNMTFVEVAAHFSDHNRAGQSRARTHRCPKPRPEHVTLADYHSLRRSAASVAWRLHSSGASAVWSTT